MRGTRIVIATALGLTCAASAYMYSRGANQHDTVDSSTQTETVRIEVCDSCESTKKRHECTQETLEATRYAFREEHERAEMLLRTVQDIVNIASAKVA